MFPMNRTLTTLVALVYATVSIGSTATQSAVQQRKQDWMRVGLADLGDAIEEQVIARAVGRAASLLDLRLTDAETSAQIVLQTDGAPACDAYLSEDGRRLHMDLSNTISLMAGQEIVPETRTVVSGAHIAQLSAGARFVARVTLDLARPCDFAVDQKHGRLELHLHVLADSWDDLDPVKAAVVQARQELERRARHATALYAVVAEDLARVDDLPVVAPPALQPASIPARHMDLRRQVQQAADALLREVQTQSDRLQTEWAELQAASERTKPSKTLARDLKEYTAKLAAAREDDATEFALIQDQAVLLYEQVATHLSDKQQEQTVLALAEPRVDLAGFEQALVTVLGGEQKPAAAAPASAPAQTPSRQAVFQTVDLEGVELDFSRFSSYAATAESPAGAEQPLADLSGPNDVVEVPEQSGLVEAEPSEQGQPEFDGTKHEDVPMAPLNPTDESTVLPPVLAPTPEDEATEAETSEVEAPTVVVPSKRSAVPDLLDGDPLYQPVTVDFREQELASVVGLLAAKANINVIAGPEVSLTAPITAYLQDVPLLTAIETVLRMGGLGIVEEEGIYRIVPYDQSVAAKRSSRMVPVHNGQAAEIEETLMKVSEGMLERSQISVVANPGTNTLIISGPEHRVAELEELAIKLDQAEPTIATVTEAVKLNYAEPADVVPMVEGMLTPEVGSVEADERSRHLIVTDMPVVIEQVKAVVQEVDLPVKQVAIEAMIVDAVLRDASQTGVNWLLDLVLERNRAGIPVDLLEGRQNTRGELVGSLDDLNFGANLGNIGSQALDAGILTFGVLTDWVDLRGAIAAEVASKNAEILANPVAVTLENNEAELNIVQDFPYQQITQSTQGPPIASTAFKQIGIELNVRPRVTHDESILVDIRAKQSSISGLTSDGIPIEDKREAQTNLRAGDGRAIFIGGLRNSSNRMDVSKIPVLGDVPVLNFLFRTTDVEKQHTELLIFLTCHVLDENPGLTPDQQVEFDKLANEADVPDSQRALFRSFAKPGEMRDPAWKWRSTP